MARCTRALVRPRSTSFTDFDGRSLARSNADSVPNAFLIAAFMSSRCKPVSLHG